MTKHQAIILANLINKKSTITSNLIKRLHRIFYTKDDNLNVERCFKFSSFTGMRFRYRKQRDIENEFYTVGLVINDIGIEIGKL